MSKDSEMQEMYDQGWSKAAEYFRPALRDKIAMAALQGIITHDGVDISLKDKTTSSVWAYEYADAMLEARK